MYHVIGLKQIRGIKNVTLKAAKKKNNSWVSRSSGKSNIEFTVLGTVNRAAFFQYSNLSNVLIAQSDAVSFVLKQIVSTKILLVRGLEKDHAMENH